MGKPNISSQFGFIPLRRFGKLVPATPLFPSIFPIAHEIAALPMGKMISFFLWPKKKFGSNLILKLLEYIASRIKPKNLPWFSHPRPGQELPQTGLFLQDAVHHLHWPLRSKHSTGLKFRPDFPYRSLSSVGEFPSRRMGISLFSKRPLRSQNRTRRMEQMEVGR